MVEIEVCWLFHDHPRAASVLVLLVSNLVNVADLGQGRSSRRNLLSLLDNLLGIGLDLLFLLFDNLGQLCNSALERQDSFIFLSLASLLILIALLKNTFSVVSDRRDGHLGVLNL